MGEVIRLVCPECDAVHRVKSVTLGKLYRCKKCRSGLITMQPAILVCPNCGATTPPTHIEVSKLITCEECEKAPLMEVRLPGIEYPKTVSSDENVEIATKMSEVVSDAEDFEGTLLAETEAVEVTAEYSSEYDSQDEAATEINSSEVNTADNSSSGLDETRIFKADTNFIVKSQQHTADAEVAEPPVDNGKLEQMVIFDNELDVDSETAEPEMQDEFDSEVYDEALEAIPDMPVSIAEEALPAPDFASETGVPAVDDNFEAIAPAVADNLPRQRNWSIPAWIPAVFALLLVGLYGLLYADLESMRLQLERSQESIIRQDQSFQEERKKYLNLIRQTQEENKKLRNEILDLKSENSQLRKKSISMEIPEIQD